MTKRLLSSLFRFAGAVFVATAVSAVPLLGQSGFADFPAPRRVEVLSFGRDAGLLRMLQQGRDLGSAQIRMIPPGHRLTPPGSGPIEFQQRMLDSSGVEGWFRIASGNLPAGRDDVLMVLVPLPAPDAEGLIFEVRTLPQLKELPEGAYELVNLTPTSVLVQMDLDRAPIEVAPWSIHRFQPKLDYKFRAPLRVAYRTGGDAGWAVLKAGMVSLPPGRAQRGRIVYAAAGMTTFGSPIESGSEDRPAVILLEDPVSAARAKPPP